MPSVLYADVEWEIVDDRMRDTILISRCNAILRVRKELVQPLNAQDKHKLRIQKIKSDNEKLTVPVDIKFLYGVSDIFDLNKDQLEALEQFVSFRSQQEQLDAMREKQYRMLSEKCYCLAIRQPWADAIFRGCKVITLDAAQKFKTPVGERTFKDIENRTWCLSNERINTRIYIYTSKSYCPKGEQWLLANGLEPVNKNEATLGAIVGSVVFLGDTFRPARPWAMKGQRHWEIYKPLLLPEPIPYQGKLKFFSLDREALGLPSYDEEIEQQMSKSV